jgi:hypothetical protein
MDDGAHIMSLEPPALPFSRRSLLLKTSWAKATAWLKSHGVG